MRVPLVYYVVSYMADCRIPLDWLLPLGAGAAFETPLRGAGPLRPDPRPVPGAP
jgi:hypothetical protein